MLDDQVYTIKLRFLLLEFIVIILLVMKFPVQGGVSTPNIIFSSIKVYGEHIQTPNSSVFDLVTDATGATVPDL